MSHKITIMDRTWYYTTFALRVFLLLVIIQMPCPCTSFTSIATDQLALLALKDHIISDPQNIITRNWTNSSTLCSWIGITCSSHHNRVVALNISNMDIKGTLPPHLGHLSFLVLLDLSFNRFSGNLPQELSQLHRLKVFTLQVNDFSGDVPSWLGLLTKLELLSLRNNSFTGFIPTAVSNLSNLQVLDFSFNPVQGTIPEELGNLHSLQRLSFQYNHLSGPIPSSIFNVSTLESIALTSNGLNGNLPVNMCRHLPFLKALSLVLNQLSGQISSSLFECSQLQSLSLSYNHFSGQIPQELGNLQNLQVLFLGGNKLTGVIPPSIGKLQNLVQLGIEANQITGEIPLSIFNISTLQSILMQDNYLTGSLPREVGNLSVLSSLYLSNNNLTGILPQEISQLNQLEELSVAYNNLTGQVQPVFNISTLRILELSAIGMIGRLPSTVCYGLPVIEILLLDINNLGGEIPHSLSNCSNLRILALNVNNFTGFVPHFFGNLRFLEILELGSNNLTIEPSSPELSFIDSLANCKFLSRLGIDGNPLNGIIPPSVGNLSSSLKIFTAFNCKIKGAIPAEVGNLSELVAITLLNNELTGNIPSAVERLHKLQGFALPNNNIGGSIPDALCKLRSTVDLILSQNRLSGSIPKCLGNVTSLRQLSLDSNMFTSGIPLSLLGLRDLLVMDLSSNSLSGVLDPEIGNLVSVVQINISRNKFSNYIPSTIGKLQSLGILSLEHNELQGPIPISMGSLVSLENLDLSHNNLSGSIPKSFEALQHLYFFNVSFNMLSGEIPSDGPFKNFTIESFIANEGLCGIARFHVPSCHSISKHKSRGKRVRTALFISTGIVALIMVLSLAFVLIVRYKRKEKTTNRDDELMPHMLEKISHYELLRATDRFSENNLLGVGSFSSVYKATLRDGKVLAIKVFNLQSEGAFKSFDVECEVLRNIRHRNLNKVIGSCSNVDFKALVLEYMPNGSLEKWLYSPNYQLDATQRLNIMIDIASALEYLHHGYSSPIVHCDLKPSNVLLDEEMIAHVSDFGIAKLLGEEESIAHTNTLATLGYISPEYGLEGLVSIQCDVYSYGIMLMETFTGKRPSDEMFAGGLNLKSWVESLLRESPDQVIAANLLNHENYDKVHQCVLSILELALKCSADSPGIRINMKEAVAKLQKIKHKFHA